MENKVRYATLASVIAIAAGLFGAFGMTDVMSETLANKADTSAQMLGHVAYIHKDIDGQVIGYQQTDNLIVNVGEDCVVSFLFNTHVGSCNDQSSGAGYTVIAIGNGSATVTDADTLLGNEMNAVGLTRATATTQTYTPASGTTETIAVLSEEFTNNSPNSQEIAESGLFNSTSFNTVGLFAKQNFSNNVTLANGESLTVEWTINVGGTGSFN